MNIIKRRYFSASIKCIIIIFTLFQSKSWQQKQHLFFQIQHEHQVVLFWLENCRLYHHERVKQHVIFQLHWPNPFTWDRSLICYKFTFYSYEGEIIYAKLKFKSGRTSFPYFYNKYPLISSSFLIFVWNFILKINLQYFYACICTFLLNTYYSLYLKYLHFFLFSRY